MRLIFWVLLSVAFGAAANAAEPTCSAYQQKVAPNSPQCFETATDLQDTDIVYGVQGTGPTRSNQSVKIPVSQLRADAAAAAPVQSVAGRDGDVTLSTTDISGLGTIATQSAASVAITGGTITGADVSSASVKATGSTTARTLADRALDTINVLDLTGIKANTKTSTSPATMALGGNTLTLGSGVFTSADIGKFIVVAGAGPSSATGQLMSVPVTSAGSYTVAPTTATVSGSPTTPASIQILTALQGPTINASGSGACTNGTYVASVTGGTFFRQARVNVTVSGGNLTSISLSDAGAYTVAPSLTGAVLSGLGSCTATANFSGLGVYKVLVMQPGAGYALAGTTVSLSGGTGTPATLGTPVVKPSQSSLASTITGYISPTQVTLADNAATAITNSTVGVWWGDDDAPAINAAGASLCAGFGGRLYFPQLPANISYGIASPLNACTRYSELNFDGQGALVTRVVALQYLDAMIAGATSNVPVTVQSLTLEGAGVVRHLLNFYQGKEITVRDVMGRNVAAPGTYSNAAQGSLTWATTSQILLGNSDYVGNTLEVTIDSSNRFENELYAAPSSWPNYGIEVYGTDNKFGQFSIVNIQTAGVWDLSSGNNRFHGTHVFNYFSGQDQPPVRPSYCFYSKGNVSFLNTACDGALNSAIYLAFLFSANGKSVHSELIGNRTWWGNLNEGGDVIGESTSYGYTLESGVLGAVVTGNAAVNAAASANVVNQIGTPGASTIVMNNPNAAYWTGLGVPSGAAFQLQPADGTTANGNARGAGCADVQSVRTAASQVCAGTNSATLGYGNTVSSGAAQSAAVGALNIADVTNALVEGFRAHSHGMAGYHRSSGQRATTGDQQHSEYEMFTTVTNASGRLSVNNAVAFQNVAAIPSNSRSLFNIKGSCFDLTNHTDGFDFSASDISLTRTTGAATMTPSSVTVNRVNDTAGASAVTVSVTNDSTYTALNISATATGSDTWVCHAHVTQELTY